MVRKIPSVRISRCSKRNWEVRYFCPIEKREVRVSTGSTDPKVAERVRQEMLGFVKIKYGRKRHA